MASLPRPRAAVGGGGWPLPAPSRGRRVAAVLSSQPRLLPDEFILSLVRSLCSGEEVRDLARRAALGPEAGVLRGRRLAARAAAAPAEGQPPTAPQPAARAAAAAAAGGGRRWAAATSMLQPWSGPGVLGAAPRVTPWVSTVGLARGPVTPLLQLSWGLILKMGGRASGVLGEDSAAKRRAEVGRGEGCSDPGRSAHPGHARLLVKGFRGVSQPDTVGEPWSSRYKGPHWLQLTDPTWVAWAGDTLAPTAGPHSCPLPSPHLPGPLGSGQRVGQTPGPPLTAPGTRRPLPLSTPVLTHWPPPPPPQRRSATGSPTSVTSQSWTGTRTWPAGLPSAPPAAAVGTVGVVGRVPSASGASQLAATAAPSRRASQWTPSQGRRRWMSRPAAPAAARAAVAPLVAAEVGLRGTPGTRGLVSVLPGQPRQAIALGCERCPGARDPDSRGPCPTGATKGLGAEMGGQDPPSRTQWVAVLQPPRSWSPGGSLA